MYGPMYGKIMAWSQETGKLYKDKKMNPPLTKSTRPQKAAGRQTQTGATTSVALPHDQIAARAFEIYLRNGCQPGQDEQNWLQAEKELRQTSQR